MKVDIRTYFKNEKCESFDENSLEIAKSSQ